MESCCAVSSVSSGVGSVCTGLSIEFVLVDLVFGSVMGGSFCADTGTVGVGFSELESGCVWFGAVSVDVDVFCSASTMAGSLAHSVVGSVDLDSSAVSQTSFTRASMGATSSTTLVGWIAGWGVFAFGVDSCGESGDLSLGSIGSIIGDDYSGMAYVSSRTRRGTNQLTVPGMG